MKNVLFVASECTPFIKTGGLADVIGSLPEALNKYEKLDVRIILPLYDEIPIEWRKEMKFKKTFNVSMGWRNQETTLYTLSHKKNIYYFISNDYYFTRKGIYGYYDDGERFVYFSQAVIEALTHLDFTPEVLHAHDWQVGITVALAKIVDPIEDLKTVFTIHNIKYQGVMPLEIFENFFNLPPIHIGGFEWNGMFNCMKAAIHHSDKVTTVSPSYAEEIKSQYFSEGLHPILNERSQDLTGIINGIDYNEYNPLKDKNIPVNYRHSRIKKKQNKTVLQEKLGLPINELTPLYIIITRLVEQKGLHLIQHILDDFLQEDIQFIVLGSGEQQFEDYFRYLEGQYPDKLRTIVGFDEKLARHMYAASDFFVMPSQFEPCGLSQLISLQYKTVPIVRETGGLKDTVTPYNEETGEGNGFSFTNYNAHDLLFVLRYSLAIYYEPTHWELLSININKCNFSWKESARAYANIYRSIATSPVKIL